MELVRFISLSELYSSYYRFRFLDFCRFAGTRFHSDLRFMASTSSSQSSTTSGAFCNRLDGLPTARQQTGVRLPRETRLPRSRLGARARRGAQASRRLLRLRFRRLRFGHLQRRHRIGSVHQRRGGGYGTLAAARGGRG